MNALVGYTGFVGSNIYLKGNFDNVYNSRNIQDSYGTNPDLLVYAGLRSEKYLANHAPGKDLKLMEQAEENIQRMNPKNLVLISTIDVFKVPVKVDENTKIDTKGLHPYGYNRYLLECWVRTHYPNALIVRLPGLFGSNIKKNFIYDFINRIPFMLSKEKLEELSTKESKLRDFYIVQDNGFYKVKPLEKGEREELKRIFKLLNFSALNFTDSRSIYQFYPLERLWNDIQHALSQGIKLWHSATEPISAGELYHYLTGKTFVNELNGKPADYNYKTIYDGIFGGSQGYICSKETILREIKRFVMEEKSNL